MSPAPSSLRVLAVGLGAALVLTTSACASRTAVVDAVTASSPTAVGAPVTPASSATPRPTSSLSATVSKGEPVSSSAGCTDASCAHLALDVEGFPAGTYTVTCWSTDTGGPSVFYAAEGVQVPADGVVETPCYYGYPGRQVRLEVVGVVTTPWLTW